jgi:putative phage-type endonuclease
MEFHELANIFPMLDGEEFDGLTADIEKNGLLEPVVTYEGKILDGRNRASVCVLLGIKPKCVEYTGDDPLSYVLSKNLKRRHLTASQRAMVAAKLANMPVGQPKKYSANLRNTSQPEAAKQLNVSERSVQYAQKVYDDAVPELADAVEAGKEIRDQHRKEGWIMDRSKLKAIGGSNIAAILNLSPYESAHSLYLRLVGELPPKEDSDVMRWGRELESRVADMFADNHEEYEVVPHGIVTHPDYDFLIASPDRILLQNGIPKGVLEIKTADISTRSEFGELMTDQIPVHYYCQVVWYLGMVNLPVCYVAVYFRQPGRKGFAGYQEYMVEASPERYERMVELSVDFWQRHVVTHTPPEIVTADSATVEFYKRRERTKDAMIYSDEALDEKIQSFRSRQEQRKEAERMEELEKTQLIAMLSSAEGIIDRFTGKNALTYKEQSTTTFDHKALCADLEISDEVQEKYRRKTPFRVLRLAK